MIEQGLAKQIAAIRSDIEILSPSTAMGACKHDAENVIKHLTRKGGVCKVGGLQRVTPADVDSPNGAILLYATQANGWVTVGDHYFALMDGHVAVDIGQQPGNRVMDVEEYYAFLTRMQR